MADIANTNVTYDFQSGSDNGRQNKEFLGPRSGFKVTGSLTFGDGSLVYNANAGVPLDKEKMGLPRVIKSMNIFESNASGYVFEFDKSAENIRIFAANTNSAQDSDPLEEIDGVAPAAMVLQIEATGY